MHGNADAMSRLPCNSESIHDYLEPSDVFEIQQIETLPVTVKEIASETLLDPDISELVKKLQERVTIKSCDRFNINQEEFSLQSGCLMRGIRVVVPSSLRKHILAELHHGHFGITRMKSLARNYCWWPGIDQDIEKLSTSCKDCLLKSNNPKKIYHIWEGCKEPFENPH